MKKLILHIGSEKTGTTTIQHFCNNNRTLLREQNIYYPKVGFCDFAHFSLIAPFHPIDNNGAKLEFAPGEKYDIRQEWQPVKDIFDSHKNVTVLISAEHFSSRLRKAGITQLKETIEWLGKDIKVEILFYVRRQDSYFSSWYSTHIKAGGKLTIDEAYEMRLQQHWFYNYFYIAECWAEQFGRQAISIKVFEKEQMPDGLLESFADAAGFTINNDFNMLVNDDNISWSPKMLSLARKVNELNSVNLIPYRYQKLNKIAQLVNDNNTPLISPQRSDEILQRYKESNENLARVYLDRPDGRLFENNKIKVSDEWAEPAEISSEEILQVLLELTKKF